jgi:hypothetical protein
MKVSTQQFKFKRLVLITGLVFGMAACNTDDLAPPPPPPFVNTAPTVSSTATIVANEGQPYSYRFSATDLDADPLSFSASDSTWLTMDPATGILSGTPTSTDIGDNEVTLTVSDGTDSATQVFTINVIAALADNVAPTFTSTPVEIGAAGEAYSYTVTTEDLNFDDLSLVFSGTLPTWATFTTDDSAGSATLTGTPEFAGSYAVEITVSDGIEDVIQSFTIAVSGPAVVTDVLVLFENAELPEWPAWIDTGGSIEFVTVEGDPDRDQAVKFTLTAPSVSGFTSRASGGAVSGVPFDASGIMSNGMITFEIFLLQDTTAVASLWEFKVEAGGQTSFASANLPTLPVLNEWTTYEFPLSSFTAGSSLDTTAIELFMVFPQYNNAAGAEYLVDNFKIVTVVGGEPVVDNNGPELLTNGDFSNGLASWKDGTGEVVVDNAGNSIFEANIENLPNNVYDVNQSQLFDIIEDETYVFSFRAKASKMRTMISGLGLNSGDFTAISEDTALTTEWQDFSYEIVAVGIGGIDSRVLFDMGGDTGIVNIDDVSVKVKDGAIDGGGEVVVGGEALTNGNFDDGLNSWKLDVGEVLVEGENNIFQANVEVQPANVYDVNQSQLFDITEGATYTFSFRAKASKERNIIAGLGLNSGDFTNISETIALTTEWQTFTKDIVAVGIGGIDSRVLFDLGGDTGIVNIDDVSVILLAAAQ